jgi:hypothetical protein
MIFNLEMLKDRGLNFVFYCLNQRLEFTADILVGSKTETGLKKYFIPYRKDKCNGLSPWNAGNQTGTIPKTKTNNFTVTKTRTELKNQVCTQSQRQI